MRVAIIGMGAVGEACAHLLASRGTARSLVLANRTVDQADAVRMDLEQSRCWTTPLSARAVAPWCAGAFRGCDILILTAGSRLRGDESRADKARDTASLLRGFPKESILDALAECAGGGGAPPVLLVVTNPVEATVTWLANRTGWSRTRIMGLGTTVETARFSRFLADKLNVDATSVWTEVIGEHGPKIGLRDEESLRRRAKELGRDIDPLDLLARTRGAATEIRKVSEAAGRRRAERLVRALEARLGSALSAPTAAVLREVLPAELSPPATRFAIAAAALEVVEAVGSDRGRVLPVSGFANFEGAPDVALALPFVVARSGLIAPGLTTPNDILREAAAFIAEQVAAMDALEK